MAFPPGFLDELRARLSLSDIVGRKVALKRRSGAEYAGLCPFHNEKTPSFTVNDKKGFFYCFGCHEKGSAIDFVMKTVGLAFPPAVEKLARDVNLPGPRATPVERERAERSSSLQQVVELAARWFQKQLRLPVGRQGLDYLRGRGLDDATIDAFRLGFAPDSRDGVIAALKQEGVPLDKLVETGLAIQPEDRRAPYDRFRGRVIFPIADRRGRVIAFGGRVIGPGEPKYLNSPETPLFHKGANLYCLDRARLAATKDQPVIVAEGYMDVIALHVAGFGGAVAPLGTALTEGQLAELWKLADEPYLSFDGDNAGRRAAARAAERALPLLRPGKSLRFLALPPGEDPDSLIRAHGPVAITRALDTARPLSDLVWDLETEGKPVDTPERRASIQRALRDRVKTIADPEVREYYDNEMRSRVTRLKLPERVWQPGGRFRFGPPAGPRAPFAAGFAARQASGDIDNCPLERALLGAVLLRPALLHVLNEDVAHLPPMADAELERLRQGLLDALALVPDGIDPATEAALGDTPLEAGLIMEHLERTGLGRIAQSVQARARKVFREDARAADGWVGQWRRTARQLMQRAGDHEELRRAQEALAAEMNEENLQAVRAITDRIRRESLDSGTD